MKKLLLWLCLSHSHTCSFYEALKFLCNKRSKQSCFGNKDKTSQPASEQQMKLFFTADMDNRSGKESSCQTVYAAQWTRSNKVAPTRLCPYIYSSVKPQKHKQVWKNGETNRSKEHLHVRDREFIHTQRSTTACTCSFTHMHMDTEHMHMKTHVV